MQLPRSHMNDAVGFVWLTYAVPFLQRALDLVLKLVITNYSHSVYPRSFKPYDDIHPDVRNLKSLNYRPTWVPLPHTETDPPTTPPSP